MPGLAAGVPSMANGACQESDGYRVSRLLNTHCFCRFLDKVRSIVCLQSLEVATIWA